MTPNLNLGDTRAIIDFANERGVLRNQLAYILATAYHETAHTMLPVRETLADSDMRAIRILENSWARGRMPWVKTAYWRPDEDGKSWLGRGYVQLTWKRNYMHAEKRTGFPLLEQPELAMTADVAIQVLVDGMMEGWFTGRALSDYVTLQASDFRNARRVVNGMDRAELIADYAENYDDALRAEGYGEAPTFAEIAPEVAPEPVPFDMTAALAEIATLREHIGRAKMALDKLEAML